MLVTKTAPIGIDWYIQQLQTKLHDTLIGSNYWNLADETKYEAYGRVYRNRKDEGYTAEVFTGSGNEYKEVFWSDALTAISFFGVSGPIRRDASILSTVDIHFVMFADLSKLNLRNENGNVIDHRADEELRKQVVNIIGKFSNGFEMTSVELWLENVLKEYTGSRRDNRLKYVDMHPVHCFRINMKLSFNPNKNC
jgi:hypothetical protein